MASVLETRLLRPLPGAYEDVAREYYDAERHPTCANLREASLELLGPWLKEYLKVGCSVLEVGAGRSVFLDLMTNPRKPRRVILSDRSPVMLGYSLEGLRKADRLQCDAAALPLKSASLDVIVASLGDPYNVPTFWAEASRVLRSDGVVLFTTPSHEWAVSFRSEVQASLATAEFAAADGRTLALPSIILSETQQAALIEAAGLARCEICRFADTQLCRSARSPKLRSGTLVTGYLAHRF